MCKLKVLLLGGTGTLSFAVLQRVLSKGYSVSVYNRGNENGLLPAGIDIFIGDFYDADRLKEVSLEKFDVVVDFLSRVPSDIERVYSIFCGVCKQYIFVSSACVYRRESGDFPLRESSPKPNKLWSYNIEKYECEKKLQELFQQYSTGSYYTIVRPYITYNQKRIPIGIAPAYKFHRTIIERIRHGKPMFVWNKGQTFTTVTYVDDFAIGFVGLFLNEKAKNEDFHITTDFYCKQIDVLLSLYQALKCPPYIVDVETSEVVKAFPNTTPMFLGDRSLPAIFDNAKIKSAVPDFHACVSLDEGMMKVVTYYDTTEKYEYDMIYEAQADKLFALRGIKVGYADFPHNKEKSKLIYYIYRNFSYKIATRICRYLRLR